MGIYYFIPHNSVNSFYTYHGILFPLYNAKSHYFHINIFRLFSPKMWFLSFFLSFFNSFSIRTVYDCLVLLFLPASNDFQISLFPPTPYYKRRTVNKNLDIALNGATKS